MTIKLTLDTETINRLDLSGVQKQIDLILENLSAHEQQLKFEINYEQEDNDPRELSEIPEIRLWYIRLDAAYPWIPFLLNWQEGELARYTAMLVPHEFNRSEGIIFNPEALEIFVMNKIFIVSDWLQEQEIPWRSRLQSMAKLFGYELDDAFYEMIS